MIWIEWIKCVWMRGGVRFECTRANSGEQTKNEKKIIDKASSPSPNRRPNPSQVRATTHTTSRRNRRVVRWHRHVALRPVWSEFAAWENERDLMIGERVRRCTRARRRSSPQSSKNIENSDKCAHSTHFLANPRHEELDHLASVRHRMGGVECLCDGTRRCELSTRWILLQHHCKQHPDGACGQ